MLNKLVVVGVGLIGGSLALDLKRARQVARVVGLGRSRANLERALQLKVVDAIATEAAEAVAGADLVLLATPVGQMDGVLGALVPHLGPDTIVTDAGSTKGDVAALFRKHLPGSLHRCLPAHPIAGSDLSGATAARYGLYEGKHVVLAPLPETSPATLARVAALWQVAGAKLIEMAPAQHDAVFAAVSHLPHVLAFTYMNSVLARPDAEQCLALAGSGFRDFTRIAGSHPEMWRDIVLANRQAILADLQAFQAQLAQTIAQIEAGDGEALTAGFQAASAVRASWRR